MSTLGRWFLDPLADLNGRKTVNQKLFLLFFSYEISS